MRAITAHHAARARTRERKRIARELHDDAIQSLTTIHWQLASLGRMLDPESATLIVSLSEEVRQLQERLRLICTDLRSSAPMRLDDAFHTLLNRFEQRTGVAVERLLGDTEPYALSGPLSQCLYWILHEALANVEKHARAHRVVVQLRVDGTTLTLSIHDDGCGFVPSRRPKALVAAGHFGLASIYERAAQVRGRVQIRTAPHAGTLLIVTIPVCPQQPQMAPDSRQRSVLAPAHLPG
jgi:signal transduction histidine kinase